MSVLIPGKVIESVATSIIGLEAWPYVSDDPWYTNRNPYRWRVVLSIPGETHSSPFTRQPFTWNGLDVNVGDWVAGKNEPMAVKIIKIESKTVSTVTAIVEDLDRFNTFNDPTGNGIGIFGTGDAVIFSLGDDGLPILNPLPFGVPANFVADIESKFRIQNPVFRYRLMKKNHPFSIGDQISISSTGYVKASLNESKVIGYVSDVGPGPDVFFIKPNTKIVEKHLPALPGNVGDYIYLHDITPGDLDNTQGGDPVFLKLTDAIAAKSKGTISNPTISSPGSVITVNGVGITLSGTSLASVVSDINGSTSLHGVVASVGYVTTSVVGTVSGPFTSVIPPITATINSTLITIQTQNQYPGWSVLGDFVFDINQYSDLTGVIAQEDNGFLRLINESGGAITIVDVSPPAPTALNRKSFLEATGLFDIPASTDQVLVLTAADGRQIVVQDTSGNATLDLGIVSVDNGALPIGSVVESGIRKADMYVVPNIPARNVIVPKIGDQAYVLDTGQGEWALYVWNSGWTMLSNQDSSKTDAETASIIINWNDPMTNFIYRVSDGSRVMVVTVDVIVPFNSPAPTLTVGDSLNQSRLLDNSMCDLSVIDSYQATPSHQYDTGGLETEINAYFNSNGATAGQAKVTISYL